MSPVFIVGMPRSGTTLLARMLEAGGTHVALPESHFFTSFLWSARVAGTRAALVKRWQAFVAGLPSTVESYVGPGTSEMERGGGLRLLLSHWADRELAAREAEGRGWIENTPAHIEAVPLIRAMFPDARIVAMIRDPRDVHASLMRVQWNRGNVTENAVRWSFYGRVIRRVDAEGKSGALHAQAIRYEDLIEDPERTLRGICATVGMEYSDDMCAYEQVTSQSFYVDEEPWKQDTLGALDSGRVGRWKGQLDETSVAVIERWGGREMSRWGYSITGRRQGSAVRVPGEVRSAVRAGMRLRIFAALNRGRSIWWRVRGC